MKFSSALCLVCFSAAAFPTCSFHPLCCQRHLLHRLLRGAAGYRRDLLFVDLCPGMPGSGSLGNFPLSRTEGIPELSADSRSQHGRAVAVAVKGVMKGHIHFHLHPLFSFHPGVPGLLSPVASSL